MRFNLIIILLLLIPMQIIAAASPTATELMNKYTETQGKLKSCIIKYDVSIDSDYLFAGQKGGRKHPKTCELRFDKNRICLREYMWGDVHPLWRDVPKENPMYRSSLHDGKEYISYGYGHEENILGTAMINRRNIGYVKNKRKTLFARAFHGHDVMGVFYGDDERVDEFLRNADRISVRDKMQKINSSDCYVIEADTRRGKYTLWIDPQHGYNIAKAKVKRRPGNVFYGELIQPTVGFDCFLDNVRFEYINGVWVPVEGDTRWDCDYPNGEFLNERRHYKVNEVLLNPDHNDLGSFLPDDIRDGARVYFAEQGAIISYTWQDGKFIPNVDKLVIDQLDKMATEILAEKPVSDANSFPLAPSVTTVQDLLDKYRAAQDKLQSFIAKGKSTIEKNNKKEETISEFRFDSDRVSHRIHFQDTTSPYKSFLWDGKSFIEYIQAGRSKNNRAFIAKNDGRKKEMIAAEYKGAPLMGICAGDYERIDSVLGKAETISLRIQTEQIEKAECYVIDAVTKRGKYTLWLDPQHGYNIAKIEVQRKKGDLIGDMKSLTTDMLFSLKNVRFEQIDAVWVPIEADMQQTGGSQGKTTKWHHKRTEMVLNPDHNTLGSFVADDIPDGTKVIFPGRFDKTTYVWQDGKPVVK